LQNRIEHTAKASNAGVSVLQSLALEAALVVSWSAGFVGIRFAIDFAPLFSILLWRSLVSGLLLLPFALALGPRLTAKAVVSQMASGALAMSGYLGCFAFSISQGVPTGLVALITDMLPLVVAILSWPVLGQALNGRQLLGTCIGLCGVLVASGITSHSNAVALWAYGLPVLGTAALALATLLQKGHASNTMPAYQKLCIQCLSAAAIFAIPAWQEGSIQPVLNQGFVGGVLWLVFVATFGAWGLYDLALRHASAARVTAILYLSPPVTMLWAWALFQEPLSWAMAAGMAISLIGIVIFAWAQRSAASTTLPGKTPGTSRRFSSTESR
jgi:drug/metabolite transporter (DMT)-like permease